DRQGVDRSRLVTPALTPRNADVAQEGLETRVGAEALKQRFDLQKDERHAPIVVGLAQPEKRLVFLSQSGMNTGEVVRRYVAAIGVRMELRQRRAGLKVVAGQGVDEPAQRRGDRIVLRQGARFVHGGESLSIPALAGIDQAYVAVRKEVIRVDLKGVVNLRAGAAGLAGPEVKVGEVDGQACRERIEFLGALQHGDALIQTPDDGA